MGDFFISSESLCDLIGRPHTPVIIDARREDAFEADDRVLPTAVWRNHRAIDAWAPTLPPGRCIVYCAHGHQISQGVTADLQSRGYAAAALEGGIAAWRAAGLPTVRKTARAGPGDRVAQLWVTRARPKIDRIACPWFVRRFVDPEARFLFVEADQVREVAEETGATPFDIEGVDFSHDGPLCSFDSFLIRFGVEDAALQGLAVIIRGADTAHLDLAPEAAGLLAFSLGVTVLAKDDQDALALGFPLYDALYAWLRKAKEEAHGWPPAAATR